MQFSALSTQNYLTLMNTKAFTLQHLKAIKTLLHCKHVAVNARSSNFFSICSIFQAKPFSEEANSTLACRSTVNHHGLRSVELASRKLEFIRGRSKFATYAY